MSKIIQFNNLSITITESRDEVIYKFDGDVDEHFRQADVPRIAKESIVFELGDIRNFNSIGIREWIYLVRDFGDLGDLVFRQCSVTVIDQINMVPDSLGNGRIESFYAPYYCDSPKCKREVNYLIDVEQFQVLLQGKVAPEFDCDRCHTTLEFDALEESYFLFFNNPLSKVG